MRLISGAETYCIPKIIIKCRATGVPLLFPLILNSLQYIMIQHKLNLWYSVTLPRGNIQLLAKKQRYCYTVCLKGI